MKTLLLYLVLTLLYPLTFLGQDLEWIIHNLPCENRVITSMVEDQQKNIWLTTDKGVVHVLPQEESLNCISDIQERTNHITVDESDNKWIVGKSGAIFKIDAKGSVQKMGTIQQHLNSLQTTTTLFAKNQQLWIGTSHGFVIHFQTLTGKTEAIQTPIDSDIYSIYVDNQSLIYIGANEGIFFKEDRKKRWQTESDMLPYSKFYLPESGGYSKRLKTFYSIDLQQVYKIVFIGNHVWILGKSKEDGTFQLIKWTNESWTAYPLDCISHIPKNIYIDAAGQVWINSRYELIQFTPSNANCELIVSKQHPNLSNLNGLVVDNQQKLWLSSLNKGLHHGQLQQTTAKTKRRTPNIATSDSELEGYAHNNLVFLVDVSNSMNSTYKLPVLKKSLNYLTEQLRSQDQLTFITYSGRAKTILPPTNGSQKNLILQAIYDLHTAGNTNIVEGMELAYETLEDYFIEGGNNKVILATDGNFQEKEIKKLTQLIKKHHRSQLHLSILYFDQSEKDSNATNLKNLAIFGGGNYQFVNSQTAHQFLLEEAQKEY